ncbi:MAG TPA: hypothetical protein PLH93_06845 [Flavobacteriales bacterium]|nr:hypothetical protein [Flavobacteriales bacterium]HQW86883.1 hypothetical protein [Flavobacteriales bacterium]
MNTQHLALVAALAVGFTACKKDDPEPTPTTPTTGTVKLSFSFTKNGAPFTLSDVVQDGAGHAVKFDKLKFYVSDIHLTDDAMNTVGEFHGTVLLVDAAAATNTFTLGSIAPNHIHEVHIALGLDSATNHADPTQAESPLDLEEMHWSWNPSAGYKFLNMEGYVDGNGDGDFDDPEDKAFLYHCATDALLTEDHFHYHADLAAGGTANLAPTIEVTTLLMGLDLLANDIAMGGGPNNQTAMTNLAAAITGE